MITMIYIVAALFFAKGLIELTIGLLQILLGIGQGLIALSMDAWDLVTQKRS